MSTRYLPAPHLVECSCGNLVKLRYALHLATVIAESAGPPGNHTSWTDPGPYIRHIQNSALEILAQNGIQSAHVSNRLALAAVGA